MLYSIKPILHEDWKRNDDNSKIFIRYYYRADKPTLVDSGIAIPPVYWQKKKLRISPDMPAQFGSAAELQAMLQKKIRMAEDIVHCMSFKQFGTFIYRINGQNDSQGGFSCRF